MAQKTLIIGIGTTGLRTCEDVLQRIQDEYGELKKIPWVRAIAFETARASDAASVMHGNVFDIGISEANWQALKRGPNNFQEKIGFTDWSDSSVINLANGTTQGAGNVRMIGRTSWMYPLSLGLFEGKVRDALSDLTHLTAEASKNARGPLPYDPGDVDVVFDKVQADEQESITIYVCGTLTGGTCSGAFVDIGYYLQTLPGYPIGAIIGLFGIPNPAYTVDLQCANAYAALKELNHFHRRNQRYEAKFATRPEPTVIVGKPPYTSTFLCRPRGPAPGYEKEVTRSYGQFIYLSALSQLGAELRAQLVNPAVSLAGSNDSFGNPMDFSTLGVSVIEYPAEHIMKGCCFRLAFEAVDAWRSTQGIDRGPAILQITADPALKGGDGPFLAKEALIREFLNPPEGTEQFSVTIQNQVKVAYDALVAGDLTAAIAAEAQLDAAFVFPKGPINPAQMPGHFAASIRQRAVAIIPERVQKVKDMMSGRIRDGDSGPNWCRDMAGHLRSYSDALTSVLVGGDGEAFVDLRNAMTENRDRIMDAHEACSLAFGWRKSTVLTCCEDYRRVATEYWLLRLEHACDPHLATLCEQVTNFCNAVEHRISDSLYGIGNWANELSQVLHARHKDKDDATPEVNGQLLYRANSQIDLDYRARMQTVEHDGTHAINPTYKGEPFAKMKVISAWAWVGSQMVANRDESYFDEPLEAQSLGKPKPVRRKDVDRLVTICRPFFSRILSTNAVDKLVQQNDPDNMVIDAKKKAEVFLTIDDSDNPQVKNASSGQIWKPSLAFFPGAKSEDPETNVGKLKAMLTSAVKCAEPLEPHRIILVEARSVFSLRMIAGLKPDGDDNFRAKFQQEERLQQRTFQARSAKTMRWHPLEGPIEIPNRAILMARILVGLATGKIHGAGYTPLRFEFEPMAPGEDGGPIDLSHELEDAAYDISKNRSADFALQEAIREEQEDIVELGQVLPVFLKQVSAYRLTVSGDNVGEKEAKNLLVPFIRSVGDELWHAMMASYDGGPDVSRYLVRDDPQRRPGYYCYSCRGFLADITQPEMVEEKCPACKVPLIFKAPS